jgi:hypothetical protein
MKLVPSNDRKILPPIDSSLVTQMTEIQMLREKVRLAEAVASREIFSGGMNLERTRRIKEPFNGSARSGWAKLTRETS